MSRQNLILECLTILFSTIHQKVHLADQVLFFRTYKPWQYLDPKELTEQSTASMTCPNDCFVCADMSANEKL